MERKKGRWEMEQRGGEAERKEREEKPRWRQMPWNKILILCGFK